MNGERPIRNTRGGNKNTGKYCMVSFTFQTVMPFIAYPVKIHIWLQIKIVEANTKKCIRNIQNKKEPMTSPFLVYHLSIKFLPLYSYTNTETLYIITKTLILSRKLPASFRDNTGSFRVCIWVLPASIDFCVIVSSFACLYPSFRDNNRLLPTSIYS